MTKTQNNPECQKEEVLNLAGFLPRSGVNGPGIRAVIWVQGCPHRCPGCFNAAYQPFVPAARVPVHALAARIRAIPGLDGVTFSGGEPFAQAGPLALLGRELRAAGLSVVTYTGYTAAQLAEGTDPAWPALLAATDLLVAGPYRAECAAPDRLKGSSNQEAILIGTRICLPVDPVQEFPQERIEFTIHPDGTIAASGFPAPGLLFRLATRCGGG